MEFVRIAVCLAVLISGILGQGVVLRYEDDVNDEVTVMPETKAYTLVWETTVQGNDEYTLYEVKHQNPVSMEERVIGKMDGTTSSELVEGYSLNVTTSGEYRKISLTIDTVGSQDDGKFTATAISNADSTVRTSVSKNVTVVKKLDTLHLQFEERDPISAKPEDALEVEAGTYVVKCIAEGSNPATTDVSLHLDGNVVQLEGQPMIEALAGDVRKFKTTVMGNAKLEEKAAVMEMECVATDEFRQTLSTKLDLKVMVSESGDVTCHETKAKEGDMAVTLTCNVDHTNLNVTKMTFQIGQTGEIIEAGKEGADNDTLTITQTTPGKSTVTLTLDKVKDWHFDTDFYLLITTQDGQVKKETLTLESSDEGGNGNCLAASLGLILFLAITALFSQH